MKGQYYEENSMNGADGFMRGGMNATVIAMGMVTNPTAASLGILCQLSMDMGQESFSSPESYTGSVMGAIIGITDGPWQVVSKCALRRGAYKEEGAPRSFPDTPASVPFCWIVGIGDLENIHYSRLSNAPMNL